jgi:hypothetical protein
MAQEPESGIHVQPPPWAYYERRGLPLDAVEYMATTFAADDPDFALLLVCDGTGQLSLSFMTWHCRAS